MAWHQNKFSDQYTAARTALKRSGDFDKDWKKLVESLHRLLEKSGFDASRAKSLDELRKKIGSGGSLNGSAAETAVRAIMGAAKAASSTPGSNPDAGARSRAAALKFLQHVYLLKVFGSHQVWVHSLPMAFSDWAYRDLAAADPSRFRTLLGAHFEYFSQDQKRHLSHATQTALRWCLLTQTVLASASGRRANENSVALVKRWFAEPDISSRQLSTVINTLGRGFKKITATLNRGRVVLTDFPTLRTATGDDAGFRQSEAFVFGLAGREKLDVIYVEDDFFGTQNTLTGQVNWARILVHELSHSVCGTTDVEPGPRYSWFGIGPHANFPSTDAVRNADNWAFFAADCANALTDAERTKALKIA